jgi:hypothetical protein
MKNLIINYAINLEAIKSGKIDNIKLKENVWYEIINNKFMEVKS